MNKFKVLRDSREKEGHGWLFGKSDYCDGYAVAALKTGDYSLDGYDNIITIERKESSQEFYSNICGAAKDRFERELVRLQKIPHSYIICEFGMSDIIGFPWNADMPYAAKKKIGSRGDYFLLRFLEIQSQYRVPIILAGNEGQRVALSLFKRLFKIVNL